MSEETYDKLLAKEFLEVVEVMKSNVDVNADRFISAENVFQPAKKTNREVFQQFLKKLILPGSHFRGMEYLMEFYKNFKDGKSSLIMAEHKSNFDVPVFFQMMYSHQEILKEIFEKIVFIAGRKLNEEEAFVKVMAEQFHRVIVAPKSEVEGAAPEELEKALQVNMATQKFIRDNKNNYILLVFPTGTRSKPWDRSTYNGLREVYNYLKNFDQIILMSLNGNCMKPRKALMSQEPPRKDEIVITFSPVHTSKELIAKSKDDWAIKGSQGDFKQYVIDSIMEQIYAQKGIMPWDEK